MNLSPSLLAYTMSMSQLLDLLTSFPQLNRDANVFFSYSSRYLSKDISSRRFRIHDIISNEYRTSAKNFELRVNSPRQQWSSFELEMEVDRCLIRVYRDSLMREWKQKLRLKVTVISQKRTTLESDDGKQTKITPKFSLCHVYSEDSNLSISTTSSTRHKRIFFRF